MARIIRLSPQIANMIAAGEVVERPGSVAKELIENAIDAGATRITVEIKNGGISYLRITDNGSGIEPEDVRTAFLRHATSKIRSAADLEAIMTLGFRGEALAAISAVSRVDLITRTRFATSGVQITLEGGKEIDFTETGCPIGTTIVVRDLFFNVPARMKFLKKDSTESAYVEAAVIHAALSRPGLSFQFIKDGRETINTPGDGSLIAAIHAVYGRELAASMISTAGSFHDISVEGCVSPPAITRANRNLQTFFVNGRYVRSKTMTAALDEAYKNRLMHGRLPVCFLNIHVSPEMVDVNVHPAKMEIKFSRENDVFRAIYNTVLSALEADDQISGKRSPEPTPEAELPLPVQTELKPAPAPVPPHIPPAAAAAPAVRPDLAQVASNRPVYRNAQGQSALLSDVLRGLRTLYATKDAAVDAADDPLAVSVSSQPDPSFSAHKQKPEESAVAAPTVAVEAPRAADAPVRVVGELFATYIIAQETDGCWLIDKHAAHERMIFNELVARQGDQDGQILLDPVTVALSRPEKQACLDNQERLLAAGFAVEDIGAQSLLVRQAPLYLDHADIPAVLSEMAEKLMLPVSPDNNIHEELLKSVSCKAAIKAGKSSDPAELQRLAEKVLSMPDVRNCPHGRPVAIYLSRRELEKRFKRIV